MKEKLKLAIAIIKEECENHEMCGTCPLSESEDCMLYSFPCEWEIEKKQQESRLYADYDDYKREMADRKHDALKTGDL